MFGGMLGEAVYSVEIPQDLKGNYSITHYEMYNTTVALKTWVRMWEDKVMCIFCDNLGAVTVCQTGKTRDPFLNTCLHSLWLTR